MLPIAGLLSTEPLEKVGGALHHMEMAAAGQGTTRPSPFAALSFLALPVIPESRLTYKGLGDIKKFKIING